MKIKIPKKEDIVKSMVSDPSNYVAIYARESNPSVKSALEAQVITCTRYARENNLIIYDVYKEFITGTKHFSRRVEFKRLIEDAKKGLFKKIIVTKRDRLTRDFNNHLELRKLFKGMNIEILYSNDVQLREDRDYAANFIENMIMAIAELEPQNIKDRIYTGQQIKRTKRIYDKRPAYGFTCIKVSEKEYKKKYIEDGVKALVIKDIFEIYLDKNDIAEKPEEIIEKLKEKFEERCKDKGKEYLEYKKIISNLQSGDVINYLSRPIYAGLQTKSLDYKYKDFKVLYEDRELEVDEQYFHPCKNVDRIISPKQWIEAVNKWTSGNQTVKRKNSQRKSKSTLFKGSFYCDKCKSDIELKGNTFTCGKKDCLRIVKDKFIKGILNYFIVWISNNSKGTKIVEETVSKLKLTLKNLQNDLIKCINEQGKWVNRYIKDNEDKFIKENIQRLVDKKLKIEKEIEDIKEKIIFLEGDFNNIILELANSKFMNLLSKELENNEQALLEIFDYKNLEEIIVDGKSIKIKYN